MWPKPKNVANGLRKHPKFEFWKLVYICLLCATFCSRPITSLHFCFLNSDCAQKSDKICRTSGSYLNFWFSRSLWVEGVVEGFAYRPVTLDWIELQRWLRPFWNWHVQAYMVVHVAAPLHPRNPPTPPQPQTKQRKPLGQTRFARLPSWLAGDKWAFPDRARD